MCIVPLHFNRFFNVVHTTQWLDIVIAVLKEHPKRIYSYDLNQYPQFSHSVVIMYVWDWVFLLNYIPDLINIFNIFKFFIRVIDIH